MTAKNTNIDKVSQLHDIPDKHMQEENCRHNTDGLFEEYEINDSLNNN
ncbi:MAG: hypothetical protein ACM3ZS_06250 [Nitrososphaerota archaeon]